MKTFLVKFMSAALLCTAAGMSAAEPPVLEYSATLDLNASTGRTAPYMIGSWNHGKNPYKNGAVIDLGIEKKLDLGKRFSWSAGVEFLTGYEHGLDYARYDAATASWGSHRMTPPRIWLQQLWGEVKFRGVFLEAGLREHGSALLPDGLSSGDLTRSGNARPIPSVAIGFVDFQDIPFTNGWVQIDGQIAYGRFTDDGYARNQYNYYNWLITSDTYYTYKRCYFRTKPSMPFSVTVGMQTAGQFGGNSTMYSKGKITDTRRRGFKLKYVWQMFLPTQGNGDDYYEGNSLGSWDFKARYRLPQGSEVSFAFQWPFEDGSGIGKLNGWDGLWGLYYTRPDRALVTGAAIEYLTFCNQSGPLHYAPGDHTNTDITYQATGGDNYYNNDVYGAYDNYGLSIGSPFLLSPLYNADGFPAYLHTRTRGFHAAVTGCAGPEVDYRLAVSWQVAWGNGRYPLAHGLHNTSMLAQVDWRADRLLSGLSLGVKAAFDAGDLRGDNFGAYLSIKYSGKLAFR